MLIAPSIVLARKNDTMYVQSNPGLLPPLHRAVKLLQLRHLSGNSSRTKASQQQLLVLFYKQGSQERKSSHIYKDGNLTVVNRTLIQFRNHALCMMKRLLRQVL